MQGAVLDGHRAGADGVEQRAVVGDEQDRPAERAQGVLEGLAALDVEVVGGLVQDQHVGRLGAAHEHRQRQAPALPAGEPGQRFLGLLAGEQEAPEQRPGLARGQAGGALGGLQHALLGRAAGAELLGVLGEVADLDVVADRRACPSGSSRRPARTSIRVVLPAPLGPTSETCSPRSSHSSACSQQRHRRIRADLDAAVLELEDHAPGAFGRLEGELQPALVAGVALQALHLLQPLDPRLRLARLGGLVAEALDEAFGALDLGLLGGDRPSQRQLVGRLFAAPVVPAAGEEARAPGLQLEHGGADRLQEPAVVGDQHDRRVEPGERLLEPFQGGDVEVVGGLVEQQHVGAGGQRPRQRRARQLAPGEGVQRALEVLVAEAEPVGGVARPVAPQVAAAGLQLRLGRRVAGQRGLVPGAVGHRLLELGQLAPRSPAPRRSPRAGSPAGVPPRSRGGRWSCSAILTPLATLSSPPSIELSPASILSRVVLPAPLRPASVSRSRRSSLKETPRSSGCPAMSLRRSDAVKRAIER